MQAIKEKMFDNAYLEHDATTDIVGECNSHAVPVSGNAVVLSGTLINSAMLSGSDQLVVSLQGSYDGQVWLTTGLSQSITFSANVPRNLNTTRMDDIDYPFIRVKAELVADSDGVKALFDAEVVFTSQT